MSDQLTFNIKHAGKVHPISITGETTAGQLREQVESLTHVPQERQKYMVKGGLTDKSASDLSSVIKAGSTVMLLGTPDANLITKPKTASHFIEDLSPDQQVSRFNELPIGFKNMGNTCYLNATLQSLFRMDQLRELILNYDPKAFTNLNPQDEMHHKLILELKHCFESLKQKNYQSVLPIVLINVLRKVYPQFAERDPQAGFYKQQDAEELFTQLFHSMTVVFGDKFSEDFSIKFKTTVTDTQNPDDVTVKEDESDVKLQCHISGTTNFLRNGIFESLNEKIEKRSNTTGVNSIYNVEKKITKLPKYLTIQYVRFFWKRSSNKKSKILRKVVFPFQLDVSDILTPEYQQEKIKVRDELRTVDKLREEKQRDAKKRKLDGGATVTEGSFATPKEHSETEHALEASEKEYWRDEFKKHFPPDLQAGENPSCVYNLVGVITHQGANSDSGHYQAFIRDENDENVWYKFNDDKVSIVEKERVEALAGGGESDSALILMYQGFGL
ncbi:ubiquitin-specific protease UBP6 KNAG_0C01940 [Huiozyma naganishii CBS 8797]|uniref:Ubiquitin carboxyl-terminal hydrolase n=1 Tax=Huiozyma naganishii (strain ATCC MYA-139 / BCRC 22969 / CBS 8797 / KCTC 17520 / NBRC 10181 / NCYC 3082 / Yp74L-3) TaxID=1071383 RepID=J7RWD0_HUIN7|nr:hypothetical protein KNAG_0C01940 [Kazachstania naganishii CBS 8797]CCK69307.1 hypothetical protein KNAG_0C01940 [Kazachstania naganishii CBS 8797]